MMNNLHDGSGWVTLMVHRLIMTLKETLLSKIKISDTGCWEWQFALRKGYGVFSFEGKKNLASHRMSYIAFVGPIVDNLLVCHTCDNRKCINPEHLFLGTYSDNSKDAYIKGRVKIPKGKKFEENWKPPNRKLTDEQVVRIKKDIDELYPSKSLVEIAEKHEISYQTVRDMRRTKKQCYK